MNKKVLFVAILYTWCMISCTTNETANLADYASIEESAPCVIPIDSVTTQQPRYIQLINDSTLCFYNPAWHDLCLANLNTKEISKIALHSEGPDAVYAVDAFYYDKDSIYVYEAWGKKVTVLNNEGKISSHFRIPKNNKSGSEFEFAVYPFPTPLSPYMVKDGKHILQGMNGKKNGKQKYGTTLIFDSKADSVITGNPYPEIYGAEDNLNNWDVFAFRNTSYALMPDGNLLINYPASDSLYVYNPSDGSRYSVYAGYSKHPKITPGKFTNQEEQTVNYLSKYHYFGILFDSSKDVYYRLLRLPKKDIDVNNLREEERTQQIAVIIFDKDFNIIGEQILPDGQYYPFFTFLNSNGIHINIESEDDDYMIFRVFKINIDE